jgi:hypothetical protein
MFVKPADSLVGDLDQILGPGSVQLVGNGTRRVKRIQQQQLFKEDPPEPEPSMDPSTGATDELPLDPELELA